MSVTTTINMPPLILQSFHKNLLKSAIDLLQHRAHELTKKADKKYHKDTKKYQEFHNLIELCEQLNVWQEKKKTVWKEKTGSSTEKPVICTKKINRFSRKVRDVIQQLNDKPWC